MQNLILGLIFIDVLFILWYIKLKNSAKPSDREILERSYHKESAKK